MSNEGIALECTRCGEIVNTPITEDDLEDWYNSDGPIQISLHYIPAEFREMLLSGICPECWKRTLRDEDEKRFPE